MAKNAQKSSKMAIFVLKTAFFEEKQKI